jgi:hypothetical protein
MAKAEAKGKAKVTRILPHGGQQVILDGVVEARKRGISKYVVMAGRRLGKSVLARDLCIQKVLEGGRVGYWVPTYPDGKSVFKWFVTALGGERSPLISTVNKSTRRIELLNGGSIDLWSMDRDGAGRGESYHIAVLEEAAKARNLLSALDETIEATTADTNGELWIISSPRGRNAFHELYVLGKKEDSGFASFRVPSYANPYLSRAKLLAIKKSLESRGRGWIWTQEYLAKPADQGINPFDISVLDRQTQDEVEPGPIVVWGIDLAKRQDFTVIVGLTASLKIGVFHRINKIPWPDQEEMIVQITSAHPDAPILMDSTGIGDPLLDYLLRRGLPIEGYHFGGARRNHLLDAYALSFATGQAYVLRGQHYLELSKAEYEENAGRIKITVPEPDHDDCMMAGALAQWKAESMGYPATSQETQVIQQYRTAQPHRLSALRGY